MMPSIRWVRDAAWRLYYTCVSVKEVADQALRMGLYDLALAKYMDSQNVHKTGLINNKRIEAVEDDGFHVACSRLFTTCETNILLASLKVAIDPNEDMTLQAAADFVLKVTTDPGIEDQLQGTGMPLLQKSRLYHYRGISLIIKGNDKEASINLRKACRLDPSDNGIRRDLLVTHRRLTAKTPQAKAAAGTVELSRLSNEPLELEAPTFTKSEYINGERYLLRKYGYQGVCLQQYIPISITDVVMRFMTKYVGACSLFYSWSHM